MIGGRTGIVFKVGDVREAIEDLRAKGVKIAVEPVHHSCGWNAVFADPDGNEFIFCPEYPAAWPTPPKQLRLRRLDRGDEWKQKINPAKGGIKLPHTALLAVR